MFDALRVFIKYCFFFPYRVSSPKIIKGHVTFYIPIKKENMDLRSNWSLKLQKIDRLNFLLFHSFHYFTYHVFYRLIYIHWLAISSRAIISQNDPFYETKHPGLLLNYSPSFNWGKRAKILLERSTSQIWWPFKQHFFR